MIYLLTKISGKTKRFWNKTRFSNIDTDNFVLSLIATLIVGFFFTFLAVLSALSVKMVVVFGLIGVIIFIPIFLFLFW